MNEGTTQFECVLSDELVGNNLHLGRGQQVINGRSRQTPGRMNFDWLKIFHLKPRYFFAVFFFGTLVLFLPTDVATKFGILALRVCYLPWVGGGTLAAFVLWAVHIVPWINDKIAERRYRTQVLQNLSGLTMQERFLLCFCVHRG
jgi:Super-infection exclusion protein B